MINVCPLGSGTSVNDDRIVLVGLEDNRRVNEDRIGWDTCVNDDRIGLIYWIDDSVVNVARSRAVWLDCVGGLTSEHRLLPRALRPAATDLEDLLL